jgi:hypothetical protein
MLCSIMALCATQSQDREMVTSFARKTVSKAVTAGDF